MVALHAAAAVPADLRLSEAHRVGVVGAGVAKRKNLFRLTFWPLRTWRIEARRCYNAREKRPSS